jgi:hypothetical protein
LSETTEPGGSAAPELPVASAADAAPPADTTAAPAPAEPDAPEPEAQDGDKPTRNGIQKRIGELVREREFWREQAMRVQQPPQQPAQPAQPAPLPPDIAAVRRVPSPSRATSMRPASTTPPTSSDARRSDRLKAAAGRSRRCAAAGADPAAAAEFGKRIASVVDEARARPSRRWPLIVYDPTAFRCRSMSLWRVWRARRRPRCWPSSRRNPEEASRIAGLRPAVSRARVGRLEMRLDRGSASGAASPRLPTPRRPSCRQWQGRTGARTAYEATSYEEYRRLRMGAATRHERRDAPGPSAA